MTRISNILIPVDFSNPSQKSMHYGARLALKVGAKLTIAHVVPRFDTFEYAFPANFEDLANKAFEEARKRLPEEIPAPYRGQLTTHAVVKTGDTRDELIKIVTDEKIDFVVMGTHGRRAFSRFLLGSTTEEILRRVPVPILTVSDRGSDKQSESPFEVPFRRVLYATDLSEAGASGLHYCADVVRDLGAHLTMLYVNDVRDPVAFDDDEQVRAGLLGKLREAIDREHCQGLDIQTEVVHGVPHEEILKHADTVQADLIVLNLQSKGRLERALLGATAERVVRSAPIPVLSIPFAATK